MYQSIPPLSNVVSRVEDRLLSLSAEAVNLTNKVDLKRMFLKECGLACPLKDNDRITVVVNPMPSQRDACIIYSPNPGHSDWLKITFIGILDHTPSAIHLEASLVDDICPKLELRWMYDESQTIFDALYQELNKVTLRLIPYVSDRLGTYYGILL